MKEKIVGKYSKNSMWHPSRAGNISPLVTLNMRDHINAISPEQKCNSLLLEEKNKPKKPKNHHLDLCHPPLIPRNAAVQYLHGIGTGVLSLQSLRTQHGFQKGISHWTRPAECTTLAHFFRSILAKSALDIFLGSAGGSEDAAGEFWTIPFSALATGLL